MLPAKITLWKKEGSKYYRYNASFRTGVNDQLMQAARLVRSGWLPYPDLKKVTDKTPPLDVALFDVDTKLLDEAVADLTPLAKRIHHDWYERVTEAHKEASKKEVVIEVIEENSQAMEDRLLAKAIESYKRGEKLPPFLLQRVIKALF